MKMINIIIYSLKARIKYFIELHPLNNATQSSKHTTERFCAVTREHVSPSQLKQDFIMAFSANEIEKKEWKIEYTTGTIQINVMAI